MKDDFKISKVAHESEDFSPKSGKWGRRRNSKKKLWRPPGKRDHKKEEKRKAKAVVTVERQEQTLRAETAQHMANVESVASTAIMHHVAESVPNLKRDLRRPRESESRKQQRLRRQAVTQMMITSTFRRQNNTYTE